MSDPANSQVLEVGTRVLWYEIESVLGQGGFGITYRAHDTNLDLTVALKEYLPSMFATRGSDGIIAPTGSDLKADYEWGLMRFIDEGRTLARFDHPGIVRVSSVFETNGTAYLVMRFEQGAPLDTHLKRHGTLPEMQLQKILFDVMDGLIPVHAAGFIHRDIKPANIYLREDGSAVLIDFGSARQALGIQTQTLTTLVSPGYAPFEQYSSDGAQQGPWTDIYALGATAYRAMTGRAPVTAVDRSRALLTSAPDQTLNALNAIDGYSRTFVNAIERAIAFHECDRPQSIPVWRECFGHGKNGVSPQTAPAIAPVIDDPGFASGEALTQRRYDEPTEVLAKPAIFPPAIEPAAPASRRNKLIIAGAVVMLALLVLWRPWRGGGDSPVPSVANTGIAVGPETAAPAPTATGTDGSDPDTAAPDIDAGTQALLDQANTHLAAGRLTRPPGANALENFRAVLARDPFNDAARAGVEAIVQDRLRHARRAIDQQDRYLARAYLDEAAAADPAHHDVLVAQSEIAALESDGTPVAQASETIASSTTPPPTVTETVAAAAARLAEPEARKQARRVQKSLKQQDYRKALKQIRKRLN